ncbi:MAG: hypothetical protein RMZ42_31700 [Nostoc sp. DedQUE05]|uniref:hypothetical protein n=1 Tax=Nostoc sp. DedQUE05 TaxID=3075391 RepID=UPI002AD4B4FE|nr:hypothetical protein [Nostoc sp. DedQUE05]MDZ8096468.1 hypothetical protein [Nostoc sp. DedQUE05]
MRSFQFITPRGNGKIERSWQCDIFSTKRYANDELRLRICYFSIGLQKGVSFTEELFQISDVYDGLHLRILSKCVKLEKDLTKWIQRGYTTTLKILNISSNKCQRMYFSCCRNKYISLRARFTLSS